MELPAIYSFPPFFTKQPTPQSWIKQRDSWTNLLMNHLKDQKRFKLTLNQYSGLEIFSNTNIQRKASTDLINALYKHLLDVGKFQIDRSDKISSVFVLWQSVDEWAEYMLQWASVRHMQGQILTIYELTQGDETTMEEFYGMEFNLMIMVLQVLERKSKVQILKSSNGDVTETGVKFL
ncbi:hypothetical protein MP228_008393 [Amoeboaphelidium protococcarum]|nr:hypothetical protein MP228_008393 [Amoeboaphelidium protococcarum]